MTLSSNIAGLWVPLITPFRDGELDEPSLRRLITYFCGKEIAGFIVAATTGEGQTIADTELEALVAISADEINRSGCDVSLYVGISMTDPRRGESQIVSTENWPIDGYLISGPNYLRPSQGGIRQSYELLAASTKRPLLIYNIPYRTGVNINNASMLELAVLQNVVGVKDCCGNVEQSYDLLRSAPTGFSVLTGEDAFFYNALVHGAPGAIVTGAHVLADVHVNIMKDIRNGRQEAALARWNRVQHIPKLLFSEPSPAPLKHWLWRAGLIDSPEVRLPILPISRELGQALDVARLEFGDLIENTV